MGVYSNLLTNAKSWDSGAQTGADEISVGSDRGITREIERFQERQGDLTYPSGYAEADEVQEIGSYNGAVDSGNFTLTVIGHTTANIAFDANAAIIEGAIDTVATGNIADWENGDIVVVLVGDLTTNAATLTYSGNSVDATNHVAVVITDVNLGGGGTVGDVTTVTNGQSNRTALAVLNVMGIINGIPAQGTTAGLTAASTRASHPWMPRQGTLQALAMQAAIDDDTDAMYPALMRLVGLAHLL